MYFRFATTTAATLMMALVGCSVHSADEGDMQSGVNVSQAKLGVFTSDASGFDTHSFYYDTGREVVVFDAQFTEDSAKKLIGQIHAETTHPITYVVVTQRRSRTTRTRRRPRSTSRSRAR